MVKEFNAIREDSLKNLLATSYIYCHELFLSHFNENKAYDIFFVYHHYTLELMYMSKVH